MTGHVVVQCLDCRERTAFPTDEPVFNVKCQRCGSLRWRVESHPFPMARPAVPPARPRAYIIPVTCENRPMWYATAPTMDGLLELLTETHLSQEDGA